MYFTIFEEYEAINFSNSSLDFLSPLFLLGFLLCEYIHVPHDDVFVSDGPHTQASPHTVIIESKDSYHLIILLQHDSSPDTLAIVMSWCDTSLMCLWGYWYKTYCAVNGIKIWHA